AEIQQFTTRTTPPRRTLSQMPDQPRAAQPRSPLSAGPSACAPALSALPKDSTPRYAHAGTTRPTKSTSVWYARAKEAIIPRHVQSMLLILLRALVCTAARRGSRAKQLLGLRRPLARDQA